MGELPFPWNIYEEKQKQLKRSHCLTDQTWGIENGLNELLASIESGSISKDQDVARCDLDRDIENRIWTERNRARLRRRYLKPIAEMDPQPQRHPASCSPTQTEGLLHASISVSQIRSNMTSDEWALIIHVAEGFDCKEMALACGLSAGNIRVKLSRLRSRFKMAS